MKYNTIYEVLGTDIATEDKKEAMKYYRQGYEIAVLGTKDGILWERVTSWYH